VNMGTKPTEFNLKPVFRDGELLAKLQCPVCEEWGSLDDDQFHGRVSVKCEATPGCTFHEVVNFSDYLKRKR